MEIEHETVEKPLEKQKFIVGIGASAGGLNALEQLFYNMPVDSGMSFVVIQHLSPDFKSLMDDLLARQTTMPIFRVTNGIELQSDSIYLIPPKTHMTVCDEKLYLTDKPISPHFELPIDIFFNSLAEDVEERAIGIILSGTGSDGSRGIQAIHQKGGLVVSQSPESAQFDGMPRSAIATNVCDAIIPPDRIPRLLIEYVKDPVTYQNRIELEVFEAEGEYAAIFALLRRGYNLDFSKYKAATVGRRIRRRMEFRQISVASDYAAIVSGDQAELDLLYRDLLIGVTEFFRDRQVFDYLEQEVLPTIFAGVKSGEDLRIWSAACATGEEAYSLAILLDEMAQCLGYMGKITIFATDVHKSSLDTASQGLYDRNRLNNVSPERLERYFKKENGDMFRVISDLRKMVVFAPHNLLNDPPFTRLDLVCCRNLLIYFQQEVQEKAISLFHFALKRGGFLLLGSSEGLGIMASEFDTVAINQKIYRKIRDLKMALDINVQRLALGTGSLPTVTVPTGNSRIVSLDRQTLSDYDALLHKYMPPGVLINDARQVIHFFGNVFEYLKMPEGRAEQNLLNMATGNLYIAISTALQRAEKSCQSIVTRNIRIPHGDEEQLIDLNVTPLSFEKSINYHYHISFERVRQVDIQVFEPGEAADEVLSFDAERQLRQYTSDLEMELTSTRENLQATVEELQTSNEELQATNEEMLAANEELQSTNEELHSVNEELYSVNSEFERKNLELKQLNSDHENLLSSIDVGTVFLDKEMRIRKFNKAVASFFKLLPQDVGRPIDHIAYHLSSQANLLSRIRQVLATGIAAEKEEETDNGWLLNRILPFLTENGQMEGVVLTFTDITTVKETELKLTRMNEALEVKVTERTRELLEESIVRLQAEVELTRSNRALRTISDCNMALVQAADEVRLLSEICRIIVETGGYRMAWVGYAEHDEAKTVKPIVQAGLEAGYLETLAVTWGDTERGRGPTGSAIRTGQPCLANNLMTDPVFEPWRAEAVKSGYASSVALPLQTFDQVFGTLNIYSERPDAFDVEEMKLLVTLAENLSFGIITVRNRSAREEAENDLRRSRDEWVRTFNAMSDQIFITNSRHQITMINQAALDGLGVSSLADLHLTLCHQCMHGTEAPPDSCPHTRTMQDCKVHEKELLVERQGRYFQVSTTPILDKDGNYESTVHVSRDITVRKLYEYELEQARDLAEAANRSKSEFLANMSHEIRTPMNGILVSTQLLANTEPTSEQREFLDIIHSSSKNLLTLINDILDLSRVESGRIELEQIDFSLRTTIGEVIKTHISIIDSKGLSLSLDVPDTLPDNLYGDPLRLKQILLNLLGNAIKFTHQGGVVVAVTVGESDDATPLLKIAITDTGIGISPEALPVIFEPFIQADGSTTRKYGGTGLGLSISMKLAELMGGGITAESMVGVGSSFFVQIPFVLSGQSPERSGQVNADRIPARWDAEPLRILVVEDIEINLLVVKRFLQKMGHTVVDARNGEEALKRWEEEVFDLILMDIQMPVMSGTEAIQIIRELENGTANRTKIIALTARALHEEHENILNQGFDGYISKPIQLDLLFNEMSRCLNDQMPDPLEG